MIEVEIKFPLTDPEEIKSRLLESGFQELRYIEERDTYCDNKEGHIRANDEALRVRETKDHCTGEVRAQINFKGKKLDARTMTRKELETGVEDGAVCREILREIGYEPVAPEVVKNRLMLKKESVMAVTACLDSVCGLGDFLELEILVEGESEKDDALAQIETILNELGCQVSDTVRTSYLSMLQKKLAQTAQERNGYGRG